MLSRNFLLGPFLDPDDLDTDAHTGLTLYEDKLHVVIEAAVPGIPSENIHLSHHHGYIIIEGEKEDETRKYYRKASR